MMVKLGASFLFGLLLGACMDSARTASPAGADASSPPAATGGATGTGGSGPAATGGSGGAVSTATGGAGPADAAPAAGPDARVSDGAVMSMPPPAGGDVWATCGAVSFKPDIAAAVFCQKYMSACGFDPAGGAGGTDRYKSLDDCMMKYTALSDGPMGGKACVAWQLCIAAHPMQADTFCPRAPEASAMSGPCKTSYL